VEQDFPMRAGRSDILTEMAPHPVFDRLPHFGENDPSTEFAPPHRTQVHDLRRTRRRHRHLARRLPPGHHPGAGFVSTRGADAYGAALAPGLVKTNKVRPLLS
jgi:hypothetical protein